MTVGKYRLPTGSTPAPLRDAVVSLGASRWIDKMAREATGIKE